MLRRLSLSVLLPLALVGFVLSVSLIEGVLSYRQESRALQQQWQRNLHTRLLQLQNSINANIAHDDRVMAWRELAFVAVMPQVDYLLVVNADGQVLFSEQRHMIGQPVSALVDDYQRPAEARVQTRYDAQRRRIIGHAPVATEPAQAGKPASPGWLYLDFDLGPVLDQQLRAMWRKLAWFVGLTSVFASMLWLWLRRSLTQPLQRLDRAARALEQGQTHVRAGFSGNSELDQLGISFDRMAEQLSQQRVQLRALERLYGLRSAISRLISRAENDRQLYSETCRAAVEQGGFELAWVAIRDPANSLGILPVASAGPAMAYVNEISISLDPELPDSHGPIGQAFSTGQMQVVQLFDKAVSTLPWHRAARTYQLASVAALPIVLSGKVVAVLAVYHRSEAYFQPQIEELLVGIADDLGFALAGFEGLRQRSDYEQALIRERALLRALIDSIPDLIFFKDRNSVYLGCNKAFERLVDKAEVDFIGKTDFELFEPDLARFFQEQDKLMLASRRPRTNTEWVTYPDGQRVFLDTLKTPYYGVDGEVMGLIGVSRDITEKHLAEQALLASENSLRTTLEAIGDAVIAIDNNGRISQFNRMAEQMSGWKREQVIGRPIGEVLQLRDVLNHRPIPNPALQVLERDRDVEMPGQAELLPQGGGALAVSGEASPLRDSDGRLIGAVMIAQDVSERLQTELQLRLAASVFESEQGMFITDPDANIVRVNKAFCRITGYNAEEVIGQNPRMLNSGRQDTAFYQHFWEELKSHGSWSGEIWNRRKTGEIFPQWATVTAVEDSYGRLSHYVATFIDVSQQKENEARVQYLAYYDALTHIPNRALLGDRLRQALAGARRGGHKLALLFLDLDGFKVINDSLGHGVGDELLKIIATRLVDSIREADTVSRLGGDEFVLLIDRLPADSDAAIDSARQVAEKIVRLISEPVAIEGQQLVVTPSIGIVFYPDDGDTVEVLLKHADTAMYEAKGAGRATYRFFVQAMNQSAVERMELESAIRHALPGGELMLCYQPQMAIDGQHMLGAEALLRWTHPQRGAVSPSIFIPIAESTGEIQPIGHWVLQQVSQFVGRCRELRNGDDSFRLSVNVSARQFQRAGFVSEVRQVLEQTAVDPQYLTIELTESVLVKHPEEVNQRLHALKDLGLHISIDDFGTGYSSLSYLRQFPLDVLKIDQSFVRDITTDPNDAAIVRTVIGMAKSLGLTVIAEGVETREQLAFLRGEGCDGFQGFLFSPAVPPEDLGRMF